MFNNELQKNRDDLQLFREGTYQKRDWYLQKMEEGKHWWYTESEELIRKYLQCRACDIARYGEKVAELTFPQPTIEGATTKQVADLVASLVTLLQESTQREEKQEVDRKSTRLNSSHV